MRKFFIAICMLGMGSSYAKAGHTVELIFEGINSSIYHNSVLKLKKIGVNKEKITESTYEEGSHIPFRHPLIIKIDDRKNENYISDKELSNFANGEFSQEDYNKFFQRIDFEISGKPLTFEWTQQGPSCLWWRNVYDDFSWDVVETSSPFVNKKSGFHHTVLKIGLRKIDDSVQK
ncbi:MAG: hypothetical protein H0X26_08575 [Alphaproteobacteria bacterium]|nr:hypothetical protein [Alphaproteobacteria bacterium]